MLAANNLSDVVSASTSRTNLGLAIGTDVQAFDSDLATIAGLTPTTDSFMQSKASAWAARTIAQVKTDLGLTGTNSGDQTVTLTGDVTGSGTGSFAATIAAAAVTLAKMANLAANSFMGNNTGSPATPLALTVAQAKTLLSLAVADVSGAAALATSNTFSAAQTIAGTAASFAALTMSTTDAGTVGVLLNIYQNSASPAVNDTLGIITFSGNNSSAAKINYGRVLGAIGSPTAGAECGLFIYQIYVSGVVTNLAVLSAAGLSVGANIVSSHATAGIGYTTGAGGTVTQATSKATGVALSKASGQITLSNAALAAGAIVSFVLTNTAIAATDVLVLNHVSGGTVGAYHLNSQCAAGSATINIRNNTAISLSEAIVISFAVIKAVTS
jgi:hypothetical protein